MGSSWAHATLISGMFFEVFKKRAKPKVFFKLTLLQSGYPLLTGGNETCQVRALFLVASPRPSRRWPRIGRRPLARADKQAFVACFQGGRAWLGPGVQRPAGGGEMGCQQGRRIQAMSLHKSAERTYSFPARLRSFKRLAGYTRSLRRH